MCGLVGMLGPGINAWDLAMLNDLSKIISVRGTDGTGILQAETPYGRRKLAENDYFIEKTAEDVLYFHWLHKWGKGGNRLVLNGIQHNLFALHVRAATKGDVTDQNAHPFDTENYIGMHNGTLKDEKYDHKEMTDSELLIQDISNRGIKTVLNELDAGSAYALVLFDKETGDVSFVRNQHRELYFCFCSLRSVVFWASEPWMLRGVFERNREVIRDNKVYILPPHQIWTIEPSRYQAGPKSFRVEMLSAKEKPPTRAIQQDQNQKKSDNVIALPAPKGPDTTKYMIHECVSCHKKMMPVDQHMGKKLGPKTFICLSCQIKEDMAEEQKAKHIMH